MTYVKAEPLTSGEHGAIAEGTQARLLPRGVGRLSPLLPRGGCLLRPAWLRHSVLSRSAQAFWFFGQRVGWSVRRQGVHSGTGSAECPPEVMRSPAPAPFSSLALGGLTCKTREEDAVIAKLISNSSFSFPQASQVSGCWTVGLGFGLPSFSPLSTIMLNKSCCHP